VDKPLPKKNYILEDTKIPIIEEESASDLPSPKPLPPTPPLTPSFAVPKTAEMLLEVASTTTTTTTTTKTTDVAKSDADADEGHLLEPTEVTPPGNMPQNQKIYAVRACEDYKRHLARYKEWEGRHYSQVPRLLTMV